MEKLDDVLLRDEISGGKKYGKKWWKEYYKTLPERLRQDLINGGYPLNPFDGSLKFQSAGDTE